MLLHVLPEARDTAGIQIPCLTGQMLQRLCGRRAVALAGCAVTNGFNLQYHRQTCGPHQGTSMKNAFGDLVQAAPRSVEYW
jgi:hypothetical protein